ncbi:MAG TPA: hydrogenase maturation protease [Gemmataceae bacterium]
MIETEANVGSILVVGYGTELRGDDGIGPRVAEDIAAANYPGVRVRSVCQLVPELAAELSEARMVLFVDALADPSRTAVELTHVGAEEITDWNTHIADPRTLLALTRAVYRRTPDAWWLTVPGRDFDFGEGLSALAEEGVRVAVARIKKLIQTTAQLRPLTR